MAGSKNDLVVPILREAGGKAKEQIAMPVEKTKVSALQAPAVPSKLCFR
jgi:hypothetical protein